MKKIKRRQILQVAVEVFLLSLIPMHKAGASLKKSQGRRKDKHFVAVRIWPSSTYTRVTIESQQPLYYKYFYLKNPNRLVLDLQHTKLDHVIKTLSGKVLRDDPYIVQARVGQYSNEVVRIVLDLKTHIKPQLFTLSPVARFQNRLVVDLYPASVKQEEDDPLLGLLREYNQGKLASDGSSSDTNYDRLVQIPTTRDELGDKLQELAIAGVSGNSSVMQQPSLFSESIAEAAVPKVMEKNAKQKSFLRSAQFYSSVKGAVVMLDPGHGGEDPGAIGTRGTKEKDVVLNIARKTREMLRKKGFKVYMTRDEDVFIPLRVRVAKARHLKAQVFVSIHADAFIKPTARGTGVYALSSKGATNEAARYLAKTQNQADDIGGVKKVGDKNIDHTLFDLTQTATINHSLNLGGLVLAQLGKINKLHNTTVNQANFAVLKAPDIPSILVESAFISNPLEEGLLQTEEFRTKVAHSITEGVNIFVTHLT